jgi:ATP-dependent DNA helicase RecQ
VAALRELLRYLDAGTCRHDFMLRYFGDEREILGGCGHCDVCASSTSRRTRAAVAEATPSRARPSRRWRGPGSARALQAIAEMLRGVTSSQRTERFGFTSSPPSGSCATPQEWVLAVLRGFLAAGWIDLTPPSTRCPS